MSQTLRVVNVTVRLIKTRAGWVSAHIVGTIGGHATLSAPLWRSRSIFSFDRARMKAATLLEGSCDAITWEEECQS